MFKKDFYVKVEHLAREMGTGDLNVLSTPSLIAFMEFTAKEAVHDRLTDHETTVGIEMNMKHKKATASGKTVTIIAK